MLIGIERRILYDSGIAVYRCVNSAIIGCKRFICNIPTAVTVLYLKVDLDGIGLAADEVCVSAAFNTHLSAIALFVPTKSYYLVGHMVLCFNRRKAEIHGFTSAWLTELQFYLANLIRYVERKGRNRNQREKHHCTNYHCKNSVSFHLFSPLNVNCAIVGNKAHFFKHLDKLELSLSLTYGFSVVGYPDLPR